MQLFYFLYIFFLLFFLGGGRGGGEVFGGSGFVVPAGFSDQPLKALALRFGGFWRFREVQVLFWVCGGHFVGNLL